MEKQRGWGMKDGLVSSPYIKQNKMFIIKWHCTAFRVSGRVVLPNRDDGSLPCARFTMAAHFDWATRFPLAVSRISHSFSDILGLYMISGQLL